MAAGGGRRRSATSGYYELLQRGRVAEAEIAPVTDVVDAPRRVSIATPVRPRSRRPSSKLNGGSAEHGHEGQSLLTARTAFRPSTSRPQTPTCDGLRRAPAARPIEQLDEEDSRRVLAQYPGLTDVRSTSSSTRYRASRKTGSRRRAGLRTPTTSGVRRGTATSMPRSRRRASSTRYSRAASSTPSSRTPTTWAPSSTSRSWATSRPSPCRS
jgi:hypothetical protein